MERPSPVTTVLPVPNQIPETKEKEKEKGKGNLEMGTRQKEKDQMIQITSQCVSEDISR